MTPEADLPIASPDESSIAGWLRAVIKSRKLLQTQAAELSGVSKQVIHHLVNDAGRRPHSFIVEKLEKAFGAIPVSCRDDIREVGFSRMSVDQLLEHCRALYDAKGPEALLYRNLKRSKGLYTALYSSGLRQRVLLERLGIQWNDFKEATTDQRDRISASGRRLKGWSRERIVAIAKAVVDAQGFLPPAGWFAANGHNGMVQALYYRRMTWGDLRDALSLPPGEASAMVKSRNGIWWNSHSEACLSNYLHARQIPHRRGDDYPASYVAMSGRKSGRYDVAFQGKDGTWFNVEIWGDKPYGHDADGYAKKRKVKEAFNAGNQSFIGMSYQDCWSDSVLDRKLGAHLGVGLSVLCETPHDHLIETVHWSNADELIAFCRELSSQQPDGEFPAEDWLRKRGKHADRTGPAYNTLSVYIKTMIGGIRKLRSIIGQGHVSTEQWDRKRALSEMEAWVKRYGMPPRISRALALRRGHDLDEATRLHGQNIEAAVNKYAGGLTKAYRELGLSVTRTPRLKRTRVSP